MWEYKMPPIKITSQLNTATAISNTLGNNVIIANNNSTVDVTNAATLNAALKNAVAGETIHLAAGNYGSIYISNLKIAGNVNIASADPTHPAVLTGLTVSNSSGLSFSNLQMSLAASTAYNPVTVAGSTNIAFSGLDVGGSQANVTTNGMYIVNSANVSVTGSSFHSIVNGIVETGNTGTTLTGNTFTGITNHGIENAQTSNVTIADNSFTNFAPLAGSHPDAIIFWTLGTTEASSNITISGNNISAGTGGAIQGIFLGDQTGVLPYHNVNIFNNTITNEAYDGINVSGANNVQLSNNSVVSGQLYTSTINLDNVTATALIGNSANEYILAGQNTFTAANNKLGAAVLSDVVTSATSLLMTYAAPLSHYLTLTGTVKDTGAANNLGDHIYANNAGDHLIGGSGADFLYGGTGNDTITAGSGIENMTGGKGTNTFVFGLSSTIDTITDMSAGTHDIIDLSAYIKAGVTPTLTNSGTNVVIGLEPGHSITILGIQANELIHTATGYII
jgi:Ca2+-binding RTX toxin-like protein